MGLSRPKPSLAPVLRNSRTGLDSTSQVGKESESESRSVVSNSL